MNNRRHAALLLVSLVVVGCSKGGSPTAPPSGPGSLLIQSVPGSATARLDGQGDAQYTPAQFDNLIAGAHTVTLSMEGYADTSLTLSVPAGGVAVDTVALRPLAGTPESITELWSGYFDYVGPVAVSPSGTFYVTAHVSQTDVLAVVNAAGVVLQQSVIPDPDANPAVDIALDSQGNAFVVPDHFGNTIYRFSSAGTFVSSFGRRNPAGSNGIAGIAVGPGDTIHVSAGYGSAAVVEKYTSAGVFAYAFPTGTASLGPIEVGADGAVFVGVGPTPGVPQVTKFSRTGTPLLSWALPNWPIAMTRGPGSTLIVSSLLGGGVPANTVRAPCRLERYSADGTLLGRWGTETRGLPYLDRHGVDAQGNIVLPLPNDRRVLRYQGP